MSDEKSAADAEQELIADHRFAGTFEANAGYSICPTADVATFLVNGKSRKRCTFGADQHFGGLYQYVTRAGYVRFKIINGGGVEVDIPIKGIRDNLTFRPLAIRRRKNRVRRGS